MIKYLPFEIPVVSFTFGKYSRTTSRQRRRPAKEGLGSRLNYLRPMSSCKVREKEEAAAARRSVGWFSQGLFASRILIGKLFLVKAAGIRNICQGQGN